MADQKTLTRLEGDKLERYLQSTLNNQLTLKMRQRPDECAEIYKGAECLGVVQKIVDEGETSYSFEISIIEEDLQ
jgi:hypothetical protein